jgi:hypothetical protein
MAFITFTKRKCVIYKDASFPTWAVGQLGVIKMKCDPEDEQLLIILLSSVNMVEYHEVEICIHQFGFLVEDFLFNKHHGNLR